MRLLLCLLLCTCGLASCVDAPEYPIEPVIAFQENSKDRILSQDLGVRDSVEIHFTFTDGDGDLSALSPTDSLDIFLIDSRAGRFTAIGRDTIVQPYSIPAIPAEGTGNGISGSIFLDIVNTDLGICCLVQRGPALTCSSDGRIEVDTFSYTIQIRDRAGHFSNVIRTTPISIECVR